MRWPWSKPAPPPPPSPRLVDLALRCEDIESRLEWFIKEFKTLRGRYYGGMRRNEPEEAESDEQEVAAYQPQPPQNNSSAHLSRRFRGF